MLIKLFKLDIKFAQRKFLLMAVIIMITGIITPLLPNIVNIPVIVSLVSVTWTVVVVMTITLIAQQYYKNLFGQEGYLMHALPVKSWQLLFSKIVTSTLGINFIIFVTFVSVLLSALISNIDKLKEIRFYSEHLSESFQYISASIVNLNVVVIPIILAIYTGISFSTLSIHNKNIGTFGSVITVVVLITIYLSIFVTKYTNYLSTNTKLSASTIQFLPHPTIIFSIIYSIILYFINVYIIKYKLNLK